MGRSSPCEIALALPPHGAAGALHLAEFTVEISLWPRGNSGLKSDKVPKAHRLAPTCGHDHNVRSELVVESGGRAMRCVPCGAEMRLVEVAQDNTKMVRGYEHHVLVCPDCNETERRLVFNKVRKGVIRRNVQIVHDHSSETACIARDAKSGMVVMRHPNRDRLQELCEWIGWCVVDGAPSSVTSQGAVTP